MAVEFLMPKLGLTMEEGTIVTWLVDDDQHLEAGDAVVVIETDKVETEVLAPATGRLHRRAEVGATLGCGELIGFLLAEGEDPPGDRPVVPVATSTETVPAATIDASDAAPSVGRRAGDRLLASPNARRVAAEAGVDIASIRGTGPGGRIVTADVTEAVAAGRATSPTPSTSSAASTTSTSSAASTTASRPATAAARQLADLLGIDLAEVAIDRRDGRITRESVALHVRRLLDQMPTATSATRSARSNHSSTMPLRQTPSEIIPWRGMRRTIAERMQRSLGEMAQLTLHMDAGMDAVIEHRHGLGANPPSYTDYVIAATARALRRHPMLNAQVVDGGIALLPEIDIALAVATDDGLVAPVIRSTDRLGLEALANETARLAEAARSHRLTLDDLEGSTLSVSSLGMYGVDGFTPVINPPNVAIVGVGRIRQEVVVVDDRPTTRAVATLSLTWDHRVLDGAPAAAFCADIVAVLGRPDDLV